MNIERLKKLESLCKELTTNFIFESLDSPEKNFGIITITGVKISTDLSYLDIFVSSLKNSQNLTKTLAKNNYEIQKKLNKAIKIRKLPKIRFRYDNSGENFSKITQTIKKIKL